MASRLSKESRTLMVVRWMLDHPCCLAIRSQTNESTEKWSDWVAKGDVPPPIVVKPPQFSSRAPHHVNAGTRSDQVAIRPPYLIAATSQDSSPSAGGIPALKERVAALVIEDPARGPKTGPTHASAIPGEGGRTDSVRYKSTGGEEPFIPLPPPPQGPRRKGCPQRSAAPASRCHSFAWSSLPRFATLELPCSEIRDPCILRQVSKQ
ncbi:hypothetical protein QAD02_002618 [Eretmocerus hayati]|uniref:Uncharacterized protein n=1 Tax=Eretmocerus hayati TaxID=131215 RepID=A0ACC2NM29_9HYME|nr:hypothetical protein QAD02_002618 [Eretmocerus hayati]